MLYPLRPLLFLTLLLLTVPAAAQADPALFAPPPDAPQAATQPALPAIELVRQQIVTLNPGLLPTPAQAFSGAPPHDRLTLNLFPDATYVAVYDGATTRPSGAAGYVWRGHLDNVPGSAVVLVVGPGGGATGHIRADGRTFEVYNLENGTHGITEILESRYLNQGANDLIPLPPPPAPPESTNAVTVAPDDGSVIDIMVVYTPTAIDRFSSEAQLLSKIDSNITSFNDANDQSGVDFDVNLVYAGQVDYLEQANSRVDLSNMVNGNVPGLHALRNQHAADIVSMIVGRGDSDICGIAPTIGGTVTKGDSAYNIVRHNCLGSGRTFAHEAGHNMGLRHDLANGGRATSYANGYQDTDGTFSTLMAYWFNGNCEPSNCPRITYWSNPRLTYNDKPLGDAETADAARALNENAVTVANYRRQAKTYRLLLNELSVGARSFVELVNADTATIPLLGWTVEFYAGDTLTTTFTFAETELDPGRLILFDEGDAINYTWATNRYLNTDLGWGAASGGAVIIRDADGTPVDFVRFGEATVPPPSAAEWAGLNLPDFDGERTYARFPGADDTDSAADWVRQHPTLGAPNPGPDAAPPPNDLYADALAVTLPYTAAVDASQATSWPLQPSLTSPGCAQVYNGIQATLWYTLTPPTDIRVEANTLGGPHNTVIAVFMEDEAGALTEVACNVYPDLPTVGGDGGGPGSGGQNPDRAANTEGDAPYGYAGPYAGALGIEARVIFAAQANTTYRLLVGQLYAGTGEVRVNIFPYYPDFDADFVFGPSDVVHVLNRLGASTTDPADINGDGLVDQTDADLLLGVVGEGVTVTLGPPLEPGPER